jgi:hypothetical protein
MCVVLEESFMMWKGHLSWRKYIPLKCARCGIKSFKCVKPNMAMYGILFTLDRLLFWQVPNNEPCDSKVVLQLMAPTESKIRYNNGHFVFKPRPVKLAVQETDAKRTLHQNKVFLLE